MTLTTILGQFQGMYYSGAATAAGMAMGTFAIIASIDFIWKVLKTLMAEENQITLLIQCSIKYGMISALITNYVGWVGLFLESLVNAGLAIGGGGISTGAMTNPSYIIDIGMTNAQPILDKVIATASLTNIPTSLVLLIAYLGTIVCYFIIACQVFITVLEWYIVGACAVLFFPFLANDNTKFMGEKAIGAIVAAGVKMMVMGVVMSAVMPILSSLAFPADPKNATLFTAIGTALSLAFLSWQAPGMAAGLLAGSPSLGGSEAISTAKNTGSNASSVGKGLTDAAQKTMKMATSQKAIAAATNLSHHMPGC